MIGNNPDIVYIGQACFRRDNRPFGIGPADRLSHLYIIGKTGTGKSTLIENLACQDLARGDGFAVIDPHGDLVERIARAVPASRQHDVTYMDVANPAQPYGYNPLKRVHRDRIPLAASGFLEVLKKTWADSWGVRMEHILRNALYALLELPDSSLEDILRLIGDRSYRRSVASSIENPPVRQFWEKEFDRYSYSYRADGAAAVQNKVGAFLADPVLRRVLTRPETPISIRRIMDQGQVLLVNLAKGQLGEDSANLLGGLLITTIGLAGFSRADTDPSARRDFFVYVDEFQSFTTLAVANMLSELRKYRVGLTVAHQYLHQLEPEIRHAVLGNVGTIIAFRLGAEDASYIAREMEDEFAAKDFLTLPNYRLYIKMAIDGQPCRPFSAMTLRPPQ